MLADTAIAIEDRIRQVFDPGKIPDEFIEDNPNIMELPDNPDLMAYVPAYMIWSLRYGDKGLVDMHTVGCLAEYGRCKDPDNDYLNFKFRCSEPQKLVVSEFLQWCLEVPGLDNKQIERALKNWA